MPTHLNASHRRRPGESAYRKVLLFLLNLCPEFMDLIFVRRVLLEELGVERLTAPTLLVNSTPSRRA